MKCSNRSFINGLTLLKIGFINGGLLWLSLLVATAQCPSYLPLMTGSAEAPKTVNSEAVFSYVITQTDTDKAGDCSIQGDAFCNIVAFRWESMKPESRSYSLRGYVNYTYTWDVVGTAIKNSGTSPITKTDVWTLTNNNPHQIWADPELDVNQVVIINGLPADGPEP